MLCVIYSQSPRAMKMTPLSKLKNKCDMLQWLVDYVRAVKRAEKLTYSPNRFNDTYVVVDTDIYDVIDHWRGSHSVELQNICFSLLMDENMYRATGPDGVDDLTEIVKYVVEHRGALPSVTNFEVLEGEWLEKLNPMDFIPKEVLNE